MIYLDNSATTKPCQEAVDAMVHALTEGFGNPSTLYSLGLEAEKTLKAARKAVAKSIGAQEAEVFFTSGGTESDNTAIFGAWESRKKQGKRVISTAVEHPAVLRCMERLRQLGADVVLLPVKKDCSFDMVAFRQALTEDTVLVSVMHVNNETGAIFPVEEIASELELFAKNHGFSRPLFHSDCVQSYGKLPIDVKKLGLDMISLSAHKVHGPKGVGALYVRQGVHIPAYMLGGGQEKGFRSGTENVPGIAGFGAAAQLIKPQEFEVRSYLKERLLKEIPDVRINSPEGACSSALNVSFMGCRAEVLLHQLEQDGICVSTGSACSSKDKGSHVLSAMGLSPEAIEGAVRFSFGRDNTKEEIDTVLEKLSGYVNSQRKLRNAFRRK